MSLLDDTAIFAAIVQQGGFSHAAKYLGLSNGLISRRIAKLESQLGVTLLKRTTRQLQLTTEGELFWQHAQRIQQELDSALCLIQSLADKPKGGIRVSAPLYFGRHYLVPILIKFKSNFPDINIDLILTDERLDPVKDSIDLLIRAAGYFDKTLKDSSMKTKLLAKERIGLFASLDYLAKYGEPKTPHDLIKHSIIGYINPNRNSDHETWQYSFKDQESLVSLKATFNCNDMDSRLNLCKAGHGIAKFSEFVIQCVPPNERLRSILQPYYWGDLHLYAVYTNQQALPKRTRLLLDFISAHTQNIKDKLFLT
jgi:DNA-binding transcriptional LysR family regulator